ncbi:MAG: HAD family hydrolase, partial [Promethearchaeia archaeon]
MRAHDKSGERKKEAPRPSNAWRSLTGRPHAPGKTTVTGAGNGDVSGADGCLFVDIMPAAAGKGLALTYVRQTLFGMLADECLVAGDSGNDVAMFQGDVERGIMVRIATPSASCWGAR